LTPQRWAQIRRVFDAALEQPERDRHAYLRICCDGDEELRKEVESLLASHQESEGFLKQPAADLNVALRSLDASSATVPRVPQVGKYQLEKRIGGGGMGSVWMAARTDQDMRTKVAVKMVRRGMDTTEILRRFGLERQVLAGLHHPNIARLIDAGSAPDGSPYLVMEYVEGTPIDQYCEANQSSISDRLKLFRSVCAAVQYAHSNLVVHRDIKAANILVTKDGMPKLLDFGIAKLMHDEMSTLVMAETKPEMRPMTLEYASPEQIRGEPITTASDVYSLGVLLYKLLTGRFPYSREDARSRLTMHQAICEKEPPKPSSVALTVAGSAVPQATQTIDLAQEETREKARRRLQRKLRGDLDTIILKALRKEPARRYLSVEQFSEDIRRYLEGHPVEARDDRFGYRMGKFVRRNPAGVGIMAVAVAFLLGSGIWFAIEARRAQAQLATARSRELLLGPALISAYGRLGDIDQSSDAGHASSDYREAVKAAREILRNHPEQADMRKALAAVEIKLGDLEPKEAEALDSDAVTQMEAFLKTDANDPAGQKDLMFALRKLGLAQYSAGNLVAALTSFSRALSATAALPASTDLRRAAAACNFEMGEALAAHHEPEVAAASLRKALDMYRELAGSPNTPVKDRSPAGLEQAISQVAANAPPDLRDEMNAELVRMRR